jgi:hypothetical protein
MKRATTQRRPPKRARPKRVSGATLVFVGPTLPADDVRAAGFEPRPPAAVGDILRAAHERGVARIALVDGYFERMAAVWHKELLVALDRGIAVYGAASMGALRAAELHAFGMVGVGAIYDAYVRGALDAGDMPGALGAAALQHALATAPAKNADDGRLDALIADGLVAILATTAPEVAPGALGAAALQRALVNPAPGDPAPGDVLGALVADDEVAVAHLPAEYAYRATSDALVNLRAGVHAACAAGVVSTHTRDALISLAQRRFYRERSWTQLDADARAAKLPARELDALAARAKPDLKAADARQLLARLARDPVGRRRRKPCVPRTWALRQLAAIG